MGAYKQTFAIADFRNQLAEELTGNILSFWMTHVVDEVNGGFYGAVTDDLQVHNHVPRSAILCARILWTYASAFRHLGAEQYLSMAHRAFDYLTRVFWDPDDGGLYSLGVPLSSQSGLPGNGTQIERIS